MKDLPGKTEDGSTLLASVIIPTYNRRAVLQKCLLALAEQTAPPHTYEVVVVDDHSSDDTAAMLDNLEMPYRLVRITMPRRTGPGGARNAGIKAAQAPIIIFLDSDLIPAPTLVASHLAVHEGESRLIGHGPVIHTTDLDHPTATKMKVTDISRAYFATGNVSIRKEHLLAAGLFDEDFVEYGWEDLELGRRLRRLKLKAVPVPEAKGYHYKPALRLFQLPALIERERQRARTAVIYYNKHPEKMVRYSIMLSPFFFWLDRLLHMGNWAEKPGAARLLERLERAGRTGLLRFLVRLITHHAYFEELRRIITPDHPARRWVR